MISIFKSLNDGLTIIENTEPQGHVSIETDQLPSFIENLRSHLAPTLSGRVVMDKDQKTLIMDLIVEHDHLALASNRIPAKQLADALLRSAVDKIYARLVLEIEKAQGGKR